MARKGKSLKISEARKKLTRLDKLIKPGEILQVTRRGKAYARIQLLDEPDGYEKVLRSIDSLPDAEGPLRSVAENYKALLYGK